MSDCRVFVVLWPTLCSAVTFIPVRWSTPLFRSLGCCYRSDHCTCPYGNGIHILTPTSSTQYFVLERHTVAIKCLTFHSTILNWGGSCNYGCPLPAWLQSFYSPTATFNTGLRLIDTCMESYWFLRECSVVTVETDGSPCAGSSVVSRLMPAGGQSREAMVWWGERWTQDDTAPLRNTDDLEIKAEERWLRAYVQTKNILSTHTHDPGHSYRLAQWLPFALLLRLDPRSESLYPQSDPSAPGSPRQETR